MSATSMIDDQRRPLPVLAGDYWRQSRRPLASLLFVAPLLVLYECAMLLSGPQALRNGADVWLRALLDGLGFSQYFLLPLAIVGILLAWHHLTGEPWRVPPRVLGGMLAESLVLAGCLLLIARVQGALFASLSAAPCCNLPASTGFVGLVSRLVSFVGAGIYEEVLFRLILLSAIAAGLQIAGLAKTTSFAAAILCTSFAFALAHYVGPYGEPLSGYSFLFRFLAGAFFAVLFVYRGFGITVGAHAAYDILVGLL